MKINSAHKVSRILAMIVLGLGIAAICEAAVKKPVVLQDEETYRYRFNRTVWDRSDFYQDLSSAATSSNILGRLLPPRIAPPPVVKRVVFNDPYLSSKSSWNQPYKDLWGLDKIGASPTVWNQYTGQGVKIAIVDCGVNYFHEDLLGNIWSNPGEIAGNGIDDDRDGFVDDVRGWDFVNNDNAPMDQGGHGTHVAGIAAAVGGNAKGIVGVAPKAQIIPVQVLGSNGSGSLWNVVQGIVYAARVGANIINLSLGASYLDTYSTRLLQAAVDFAASRGTIIVAAAGNSNSSVNYFSPANLNNVIAVGATDPNDKKAVFSNYGSKLFLTAPGVDILSLGTKGSAIGAYVSENYYRASGTSMAAPYVSGAIALLLSKYPYASLSDIRSLLSRGAVDLGKKGFDVDYGYGRLDVARSLALTLPNYKAPTITKPAAAITVQPTATAAKSSTVMSAWESVKEFIADFMGPGEEQYWVTNADVARASRSLVSVGETTYEEKARDETTRWF